MQKIVVIPEAYMLLVIRVRTLQIELEFGSVGF